MQFSLFPLKRLDFNSQYKAELSYRVKGKNESLSWAFVTKKPTEAMSIIETQNATVHLDKGKSHILYFPPADPQDMIKNIQFPEDVDITFIDHNTLKLTVMDESLDDFTIKSKNRTIRVKMD